MTDDNLLSRARRDKNPPFERRPQSVGPLTVDKDDAKGGRQYLSTSVGRGYPGQGGSRNHLSSRRSFEDLQDVDEERALAMALEFSKAEYESTKSLIEDKYP